MAGSCSVESVAHGVRTRHSRFLFKMVAGDGVESHASLHFLQRVVTQALYSAKHVAAPLQSHALDPFPVSIVA